MLKRGNDGRQARLTQVAIKAFSLLTHTHGHLSEFSIHLFKLPEAYR